ncbi:DNA repair protein RadA-like protein [Drosera capensis]
MKALRMIRLNSLKPISIHPKPTSQTPRSHLNPRPSCLKPFSSSPQQSPLIDADPNSDSISPIQAQNRTSSWGEAARVWSNHGNGAARVSESESDEEVGYGRKGVRVGVGMRDVVLSRKKGKRRVQWVCGNCGDSRGQWWGTCPGCGVAGTMKQCSVEEEVESGVNGFGVAENAMKSWLPEQVMQSSPIRLREVNRGIKKSEWRIPLSGLFGNEVARVLGGGVVPGSLILVGGDPGVGKSTLLLQVAAMIADGGTRGPAPVLYVSGEESVEQIGDRADRMKIDTEELFLYSSTNIEDILEKIQHLSPRALVIDSIQTVYLRGVTGGPGGLQQVRECTSALLRFAKKTNIPVLLIGHVNKSGDLAGPRVMEHIVDGEKHSSHRLLRSAKNRFGSTDELGVFQMSQSGLQAVPDPSEMFLREPHLRSEHLAGLAVAVVIEGSRSFLIEVQALCVSGTSVARHVNGVPASRADMIISVLMKQAGLKLEGNTVFLNVVSGVTLSETAGDLAVSRIEKRVSTVAKLGYKLCIVPKSVELSLTALGFRDLKIYYALTAV